MNDSAKKKAGRPFALKFETIEELQEVIDDYFDSRKETRTIRQRTPDGSIIEFEEEYMRPPTMAGLAEHLGVVRATIWHMMQRAESEDIYKPAIARALNRIAIFAEEALYTREGNQGAKFSLEVNHKYGREEGAGSSGGFVQLVIAPSNDGQPTAIPKWEEIN